MKTLSNRKRWAIGGTIVLAACLVVIGIMPREEKPLASLGSVAEAPESDLRNGRLVLRNTTTNQLILIVCGTETFTNGTWHLVADRRLYPWTLEPGKTIDLKFNPSSGTNKWRGVLQVFEPDHRLTSKLMAFGSDALGGFKRGFNWPNRIFNGPPVVTREIEP